MPSYANLLAVALDDTLACQDPASAESRSRAGAYPPLGPFLSGGYPTTAAALDAVAHIADRYRENDVGLSIGATRDEWRMAVSRVMGERLNELLHEPDARTRWNMLRTHLKERAALLMLDLVHHVPVWLFVGQELEPFSIGPVTFLLRDRWPELVATRLGAEPAWRAPLMRLWTKRFVPTGPLIAGVKGVARSLLAGGLNPSKWRATFAFHRSAAEPRSVSDARSMVRFAHPDQWIACSHVVGFGRAESNRRGLLSVRVALDTVRLVIAQGHRHLISTAADSVVPFSVDGMSQLAGADVVRRWRNNRPGVTGGPKLAQQVLASASDLFTAAGRCIAAATDAAPTHECPGLADRWFNACHWFGRACLDDADFTAIVMLVIALDVLCGGLQDRGIVELTCRLHDVPASQHVLPGISLKALIEKMYKLRSEVAHGSVLALHEELDVERSQLEGLAATAIAEYAIKLDLYARGGGADDRDDFRDSLPPFRP